MKIVLATFTLLCISSASPCLSHQGHGEIDAKRSDDKVHPQDQPVSQSKRDIQRSRKRTPVEAFRPFADTVNVRSDGRYLFVESNGLPSHNMMVGIRSWQQQVPLPQPYTGSNAWRIPLNPKLAANPISAKTNLFRGAIAIAVNGVPIFNALNNRGEDALLAGELDQWGGHCGRGDDYHYHIAPIHLEDVVGKGNPIAYALDGFPIFGYTGPDGADVGDLDEFNGQFDADGNYHYHATKTYPYINGGMRGEVTVRAGQIDPQPRDSPARPAGSPLRGATISNFERNGNQFQLEYKVSGRVATISYTVNKDGSADFQYKDLSGKTRTESYQRRRGEIYLPVTVANRESLSLAHSDARKEQPVDEPRLIVTSSAFSAGSELPSDFTGDGLGQSPPVSWTKGPADTACYAVNLWHTPPTGDAKSYWLIYDIPPDHTTLPQNVSGIGVAGINDKGTARYDPMKSRGPGAKQYHITVYALSEMPRWRTSQITRADLLESIADITLAQGTLTFQYTRSGSKRWATIAGVFFAITLLIWLVRKSRTA